MIAMSTSYGEEPNRSTAVPPQDYKYLAGARHPTVAEIRERFLIPRNSEARGLELPGTIAIAGKDGSSRCLLPESTLHIPSALRDSHILAHGENGTGKTTRIALPSIWCDLQDGNRSLLIVTCKSSDSNVSVQMCEALGRPYIVVNFADPTRSVGVNLLQGTNDEVFGVFQAASESLVSEKGTDNPFWKQQALQQMHALFLAGARSFGEILDLVEGSARRPT